MELNGFTNRVSRLWQTRAGAQRRRARFTGRSA